ncbi:MAG: type II toxin-antitoxin system Phd/YefM family antitoxin [Synergistaceae bacterium]|nr:type II toxin-antitoxin system Phd/YefM family antitoxin [Synergistaceae bacterium]
MNNTMSPSIFDDIIAITEFNKGRAGKIFESVKSGRPKIVFKNNVPECVLISPELYKTMLDKLEDIQLITLCDERMKNNDDVRSIPSEEINKKYGYTDSDLADADKVEIE